MVLFWTAQQYVSALSFAVWASGVHAWVFLVGKGKGDEPSTSQELRRVKGGVYGGRVRNNLEAIRNAKA